MNTRKSPKALIVSAALIAAVVSYEGYVRIASVPVKTDVPTVGHGTTVYPDGTKVQLGDVVERDDAKRYLVSYLMTSDDKAKQCLPTAEMTQKEYDIALDFSYQYGVPTFCSSRIAKYYNANEPKKACESYLLYKYKYSTTYYPGFSYSPNTKKKWRFDCTTPGNRICSGVGTRQLDRYNACIEEVKNGRP